MFGNDPTLGVKFCYYMQQHFSSSFLKQFLKTNESPVYEVLFKVIQRPNPPTPQLRIYSFFFNRLKSKKRRNRRQEGPRDECSTTEDLELSSLHLVAERDPMPTPKMCLYQKQD